MSGFYVAPNIDFFAFTEDWLSNRMLFIAGPRQVGKTTYALKKIGQFSGDYFNWDDKKVRDAYAQDSSFFTEKTKQNQLIVFDEIHKMNKWKNILKGAYDIYKSDYRFLITGSAKLDTFRRSGDSLVGRYFLTHLFPLSMGDLIQNNFKEYTEAQSLLKDAHNNSQHHLCNSETDQLLNCGGFPEPFFKNSESFRRRWQRQHQELLIREDLRDLSSIHSLDVVERLTLLLEPRVARPCSIGPLAQDLEVDFKSVKRWLAQLEKLMLIFSIKPWNKKITRSMHKNSKFYFYDWTTVTDPGPRLENFVAAQLMKACVLWRDRFGYKYDLYYIRTYDDAEVDFLISFEGKPWLLIEVKNGQPEISSAIHKFKDQLKVPALVLTNLTGWNVRNKNGVSVMSLERFLAVLP